MLMKFDFTETKELFNKSQWTDYNWKKQLQGLMLQQMEKNVFVYIHNTTKQSICHLKYCSSFFRSFLT